MLRKRLVLGLGVMALVLGSLLGVACGDDEGDGGEPGVTETAPAE